MHDLETLRRMNAEAVAKVDKLIEVKELLREADKSVAWAYGDPWTPAARHAHDKLRAALHELFET